MELPPHSTQHGGLHLGVGVPVNPGDSALAAMHSHHQESMGLQHHGHGNTTGGMNEETKKKRTFLLRIRFFLIISRERVKWATKFFFFNHTKR